MSYRRTFKKRIEVHYDGWVDYPKSESGGRKYYEGKTYEDIEVDIDVDTEPFDRSVEDCGDSVVQLTEGVVATEAAQVLSIRENSKKVGDTIINGFFKTVQFEISTQVVELQKRVDALLLDLKEKGDRLKTLQRQMEADYNRTSSRYSAIFGDLNKELENRVIELDRPIYNVANAIDKTEARSFSTDMVQTIALAGKETAILEAQIGAAVTKQHATRALNEARTFLIKKQQTDITLSHCSIPESANREFYAPVCCIESCDSNNVNNREVFASSIVTDKKRLENADISQWKQTSPDEKEIIDNFFNVHLNEAYANNDPHSKRVRDQITNLFTKQ